MKNNTKNWQLLAAEVQLQNDDPYIKCLRELMKLSHFLSKYLDAKLSVYGLNRTQRRIIVFIVRRRESMTPTELSKLTLLTIDTINKSIDSLDKMGLTRSYRSKKDRRVRRVTLTEKGLEMIEKNLPLRYEALSQVMGCLSEGEIKTCLSYIQRLLDQVSQLTQEAEQKAVHTASVATPT